MACLEWLLLKCCSREARALEEKPQIVAPSLEATNCSPTRGEPPSSIVVPPPAHCLISYFISRRSVGSTTRYIWGKGAGSCAMDRHGIPSYCGLVGSSFLWLFMFIWQKYILLMSKTKLEKMEDWRARLWGIVVINHILVCR